MGTFSKGMKQKVAIARALVHDPNVLFLDEPTANLDPESAKTTRDFILDLKKEGRTIFLNTHNLDEAQKLCDRIGILRHLARRSGIPDRASGVALGKEDGRPSRGRDREAAPGGTGVRNEEHGELWTRTNSCWTLMTLTGTIRLSFGQSWPQAETSGS